MEFRMNYNLDKHDMSLILDALGSYKLDIEKGEVWPWTVEDVDKLVIELDTVYD